MTITSIDATTSAQTTTPLLVVDGLDVGYRDSARRPPRLVLRQVSAQVPAGHLTALVGPNGSGKSTLLRSLARLQPFFAGTVVIAGDDAGTLTRRHLARRLATVLTDRFDAGRLRVRDVVALGRHPHSGVSGRLDQSDHDTVERALHAVDAHDLAHRDVSELSDGQRQRVMVARALAQEPSVLLLDEPTAFLDPPGRVRLLELLREVCTTRNIAVVVCTHDIEAVLTYADSLWVAGQDGHLTVGGPEDLAYAGQLAEPFATNGVQFDVESLTFRADRSEGPSALVNGTGTAAALARHCLHRAGFNPHANTPHHLHVHASNGRWEVRADNRVTVCDSLSSLHDAARAALAATEADVKPNTH